MRRTLTQSKYAVYSLLSLLFVTIHRISEFISLLTHVLYVYNAHITWRKENDIMAKYVYPAIFTPEEDGKYSINFPDIDGCYTCGDDLADGMNMAQDALKQQLNLL